MQKVFDDVKAVVAIAPQATDTAVTSASIDTEAYHDGMVVVNVGATSGTPTSFTVNAKVTDSADDSTFADVPGIDIVEIVAADKTGEIRLNLDSIVFNRYIKVVVTAAMTGGTSPDVLVAANVLLGSPAYGPVGNSDTAD